MARLRADFVFGTLQVEMMSDADTLYSPALSRLPVVSSENDDIAAITIQNSTTGDFEIVHVLGHIDGGDAALVLRGAEGTTALDWPEGTKWVHGPTAEDFVASGSGLLSPKYKGPWVVETEYVVGDLVRYDDKLWEALVNDPNIQTPTGPTADAGEGAAERVLGGSNTAGGGFNPWAAQEWTVSEGGVFTRVRPLISGNTIMKIGFSATKPSNSLPESVDWLCYAEVGAAFGNVTADLSEPLTLVDGQTVWAVAVRESAGSDTLIQTRPKSEAEGVTAGPVFYCNGFGDDLSLEYGPGLLSIQAVRPATEEVPPVWGLALDFT